ncbi:uncharacterized protein LOC131877522 [Tigriopus californicus]|uniref:uncharacterized protein LOC131877522 n=1 Tax=Tigriopus californicus TaxID=6832 RepID=UPI0027DAAD21|nr:uncharacterized protein LOC131877522 [Tigriopus californicus]
MSSGWSVELVNEVILFMLIKQWFACCWACEPNEACFDNFRITHCVSDGINYQQPEIFVENNSSMAMCHKSCHENLECEHVTYNSQERICYGRSKKSEVHLSDNPNMHTMPKFCVPGCSIDATDFLGNDIGQSVKTADPMECQTKCQANPECMAIVWAHPWSSFVGNACYLKHSVAANGKNHNSAAIAMPKYCLGQTRLSGDFYRFKDSRYKFVNQRRREWDASRKCQTLQGKLVAMETAEEYAFIQSAVFQLNFFNSTTFSGDYRIGLSWTKCNGWRCSSHWTGWGWNSEKRYDKNVFNVWCSGPHSSGSSTIFVADRSCVKQESSHSQNVAHLICELKGCDGLSPPSFPNTKRSNRFGGGHGSGYRVFPGNNFAPTFPQEIRPIRQIKRAREI